MESLTIAAKDQELNTCYHQRNGMKQPTDRKCRMCCKAEEHIKYIVVRCTTLAPFEDAKRHYKVAGYVHWMICKHMGLQVPDKCYEHVPDRVICVNSTTIMWDVAVITD
jgi:hypothetical protein